MKHEGEKFKGKKYDIKFEWDDNKIYCSELIWKVYQRSTGIELCKLGKLKDFDFSKPTVKQILKNNTIPPCLSTNIGGRGASFVGGGCFTIGPPRN